LLRLKGDIVRGKQAVRIEQPILVAPNFAMVSEGKRNPPARGSPACLHGAVAR
jgi:hypothetical protein